MDELFPQPPGEPIDPRAQKDYDRSHCPVCNWEVPPGAAKCPFCGAEFDQIWQRSSGSRVVVHTLLAALKLGYVPVIVWGMALYIFTEWERVLPLYLKDPKLGLSHWIWYPTSAKIWLAHPALEVMLTAGFALLWIILLWPPDTNRAGDFVNGLCTWILFFPVPLTILLLTHPTLAGPVGSLFDAIFRYGI